MPINRDKQQVFQLILLKWLPVILTGIVIFAFPPAAIAVILAYFTAPISAFPSVNAASIFELPITERMDADVASCRISDGFVALNKYFWGNPSVCFLFH